MSCRRSSGNGRQRRRPTAQHQSMLVHERPYPMKIDFDNLTTNAPDAALEAKPSAKGRKRAAARPMPEAHNGPDSDSEETKVVDPRNALNELTSTQWLPETVSVWVQKGLGANHEEARIERQHPAPFSFTDVARIVRFFTKRGDVVLDPFVGVGSTLKACALENRNGMGFELNPRYATLAEERLRSEVNDLFAGATQQIVRVGDARDLIVDVPDSSVDLVVTSPLIGIFSIRKTIRPTKSAKNMIWTRGTAMMHVTSEISMTTISFLRNSHRFLVLAVAH
ncbi:DNA methyltransferase [Ralstonia sp. L16]|uniref:DNA methyltransferase n=1 Tax=Ralstonia sp. L16 TaxID=3423950 RepID=UPI003F796C89